MLTNKFFNLKAKILSDKTRVDVCVMVLDGCKLNTFFTKNGRFEKKIKNNLQAILDIDELDNNSDKSLDKQDKEIQCNLSIKDELKLSIPRIQFQGEQQTSAYTQKVNSDPLNQTSLKKRAKKVYQPNIRANKLRRACKK
jgi:hypothetical protein